MVRVCERWDRVQGMESPVGYLYRTAFNLNRKRLRRLAVQARRLLFVRGASESSTSAVEDRDEIDRLLARLSAGQRQALILVDWLGLSDEEAGRVLGIKPVSVRVRVSRAHTTLRAARETNDE
jgi:RNA polymerase sigma factor (sigma-70 family)